MFSKNKLVSFNWTFHLVWIKCCTNYEFTGCIVNVVFYLLIKADLPYRRVSRNRFIQIIFDFRSHSFIWGAQNNLWKRRKPLEGNHGLIKIIVRSNGTNQFMQQRRPVFSVTSIASRCLRLESGKKYTSIDTVTYWFWRETEKKTITEDAKL